MATISNNPAPPETAPTAPVVSAVPKPPAPPVPPPPQPAPAAPVISIPNPFEAALNAKQQKKRRDKAAEASIKMRKHLWPTITEADLWLREDKTKVGFTTIPRTLPLLMSMIDDMSKRVTAGKAVPAGRSYLVLWSRVFDEGFLKIDNEATAAFEAGYAGQRNVTTWREHLRVLKDLGFIDYRAGPAGPCNFILILNPYKVIMALKTKGWVQDGAYTVLLQRAFEIGATDLDESGSTS